MKKNYLLKVLSVLFSFSIIVCLISCKDDDDPTPGTDPNPDPHSEATIQKANLNILDYTYYNYLWNDKLPNRSIFDITAEPDPEKFFAEKLRNKELDRWSYVTDEADKLFDSYEGKSTTYGYSLSRGEITGTGNYFVLVDFVYPDSPAEKAGIMRGDIIVLINGQDIYSGNYMDLVNSSSITLQMGIIEDNKLKITDRKVSMQSVDMTLNPVNTYKVIDKGQKKIGYLCYTDFTSGSETKLVAAFTELKSQGITDLVLDLRYNGGGADVTSQELASMLVPADKIEDKENYFLTQRWNNNYMNYYKQKGDDLNYYFVRTGINMGFPDKTKLYILTSQNTASASEALIAGLMPYLDVVLIGETTHGKYCGAALIQFGVDSEGEVTDEALSSWAISLVVFKFANKEGLTDFSSGLRVNHYAVEDWQNLLPFGDENDPLVAKAIEVITGIPTTTQKASLRTLDSSYQLLPNQRMSPLSGGMNKIIK